MVFLLNRYLIQNRILLFAGPSFSDGIQDIIHSIQNNMEKLFKHSFKRLLETTHLSNLVERLSHKHQMIINLDIIILNSEIPNLFKLELFRIKPFPRI